MWRHFWRWAKPKFLVDRRLILTYCVIYFVWGLGMNWVGQQLEIADIYVKLDSLNLAAQYLAAAEEASKPEGSAEKKAEALR